MTEYIFEYILVGILGLLSIFSFLIGFEQMVKVVVSSYIINIISLSLSNSLNLLSSYFGSNTEATFFGLSYVTWQNIVESGHTTIVLAVFGGLLLLVFRTSKLNITLPDNELVSNIIQVLLIPLTVFAVIFSLQVAIFGDQIVDLGHMESIAKSLSDNPSVQQSIILTPLWLMIHAIITLRITTQVGVRIYSNIPEPTYE